jgi:hypothetical protein
MSGVTALASLVIDVRKKSKTALFIFLSVLFVTAGLSGQTPAPGSSLQSEKHGCSVAEPNIDGNTDV